MLRRILIAAVLCAASSAGETFDRIAVSVGNQVITESTILRYLRVGAFLDRAPLEITPAKKREAADQLVDQLLIQRDIAESHLNLQSGGAAVSMIEQVKAMYGTAQEYEAALKQYRIQESDVREQLEAGLTAFTFTELRFRPGIQITDEDLRAYYNTVQDASTFEAAREEIEEVLGRQRETEALDKWLMETRATLRIEYREQVFR